MNHKSRFIVVVFKNMSRKSRFRVVVFPNESPLVNRMMNRFLPRAEKQNKILKFFCLVLFLFARIRIHFYNPKIPICNTWANIGITSSADLLQILLPKIQISLGKKYMAEVLVAPDNWQLNQRGHGGGRKRFPIARPSVRWFVIIDFSIPGYIYCQRRPPIWGWVGHVKMSLLSTCCIHCSSVRGGWVLLL